MRGFFCALFAGILCLESIGGFCRQGYVSEEIREQATHLFNETAEKEAGQLQEDLHLYAQAAVLLDADSGRVLYGKNEETPMAMASTTKIMTCILVLENAKVEEEVSISAYAATMPKVKLYVKKGEHYTVRELLFSLMLESHNDAAAALAEYIGGKLLGETKEASEHTTEESKAALHRFAQAMNEKAVEIGCEDTWFITPNGLDATETLTLPDGSILEKEHHTTAKDLACILRYCIRESSQRDLFREITRTQEYCFTENGRSFQCHNHNAFLQMMDGAFTGKTGFTNKAGYCYVGALERDGKCMIVALLACGWPNHKTYKWRDSRELFGYGLENFVYRKFGEEEFSGREQYLMPIPVTEAQDEELTGEVQLAVELDPEAEGAEGLLMRADEKVEILYRKEKELKAPVIYVEGEEKGFSFWRSELMGNDIDLCVSYRIENPLQLLGLFSYDMDQRAKVHKWIGYTGSGNEDGTYVYITETGKSYHWFSDCTYLDLSILAVPEETVSGLRNDSGAKYKDCEKCRIGKKDTKTVFVTEYGEAVHNSLSCSGLKRTVYRILLEEAGNHSPCGKCEKRKAS